MLSNSIDEQLSSFNTCYIFQLMLTKHCSVASKS